MRSHELEAYSNDPRLGYYSHSRPRLHPRLQAMSAVHTIEELAARHAPAVNAILEEADGLTDRALQIQAMAGSVMAVL